MSLIRFDKISLSFLVAFFSTALLATSLYGADCALILEELSELKGLMKRQVFLKQAVKECPDDAQINYFYAYNLERLRKYDDALYYYEKAVSLGPDYAKSYFGLGDVYLMLGKPEAAILALEKGLAYDPENIWAKRSLKKAQERFAQKPLVSAVDVNRLAKKPVKDAPPPPTVEVVPSSQPVVADNALTAEGFVHHMAGPASGKTDGKGHVLMMQIQFQMSSGNLTAEAMERLDAVVCLALQSDELRESRFEVAGHTDDSGNFEHNMRLSRIRAHTVKEYLVENCQIDSERLSVVYYGQTRPAVPNTSRQNRKLNRRVEFRRLP